MFSALVSSPQVHLSSPTNTQGLPLHQLTYIAFEELKYACPLLLRLYSFKGKQVKFTYAISGQSAKLVLV